VLGDDSEWLRERHFDAVAFPVRIQPALSAGTLDCVHVAIPDRQLCDMLVEDLQHGLLKLLTCREVFSVEITEQINERHGGPL